jgi:hypothetical protein
MAMPKRSFCTLLGAVTALSFLTAPLGAFAQDASPGVGAWTDRSATSATCTRETGRDCIIMRGHCELECTIVSDPKGCQRECERGFQECHRPGC